MTVSAGVLKAARLKSRYECLQVANKIAAVLENSDRLPLHVGLKTDPASDICFTPGIQFSEMQNLTGIGPNAIAGLTGLPLIRAGLKNIQTALVCEAESEEVVGAVTFRNMGTDVPQAMRHALGLLRAVKNLLATDPDIKDGEYNTVVCRLEQALALFETEKKSGG